MTKNPIKIAVCRTEPRAEELAALLNSKGYPGGIIVKDDTIYLKQNPREPYSKATVQLIKAFAKAWNKLINKISV